MVSISQLTPVSPYASDHEAASSTSAGPDFYDLLDVVNPLQHIPVISHMYRAVTGDTISTGAQIAGGALFGGVVGAAAGAVTALAESVMGDSLVNTAVNAFTAEDNQLVQLYAPETKSTMQASSITESATIATLLDAQITAQQPPQAPISVANNPQSTLPDFRHMRDEALGLTDSKKQRQLQANMVQTLINSA